jgi:hypothetical protein
LFPFSAVACLVLLFILFDLSEMLELMTRDLMMDPKPLVEAQKKALPVGCGGGLRSL